MPHKTNPVLSVLVRRAALSHAGARRDPPPVAPRTPSTSGPPAPGTPSGRPLRTLLRRTSSPPRQTTDLVAGLEVHDERMAATPRRLRASVRAEQRAMSELAGARAQARDYLGATDAFLEAPLARAAGVLADGGRDDPRRHRASG